MALAIGCVYVASYRVWNRERNKRREAEEALAAERVTNEQRLKAGRDRRDALLLIEQSKNEISFQAKLGEGLSSHAPNWISRITSRHSALASCTQSRNK
jgi:hypothetical protein